MPHVNPDPNQVAEFYQIYQGKPLGFTHGHLIGIVERMAKDHAERCLGCETCDDLVQALSAIEAFKLAELPPHQR